MRLLGLDFGTKRVGVASTDESGTFAIPRVVLPNNEDLLNEVIKLAGDAKIVIGESKDFKGQPNAILAEAQKFAAALRGQGKVVVFHTEVLTSMEADRLQGSNEMNDASAAALILKSYIDSNK